MTEVNDQLALDVSGPVVPPVINEFDLATRIIWLAALGLPEVKAVGEVVVLAYDDLSQPIRYQIVPVQ